MPFTRKSDSKQVKVTRSEVGVSEENKASNRNEGVPNKQEKDTLLGAKMQNEEKEETGDNRIMENQINIMEKAWKYHGILLKKKDKVTLIPKEESNSKSEDGMVIKDEKVMSSKKRKLSNTTSELSKRTKTSVPEVVSPRRSSRAVVPNSRYKDMEVINIGKKKSSTPSSTGYEKRVKERAHVAKNPGQNILDQSSKSNIVSEEVITCETQIVDNLQMSLMDDLSVLSPNATETKHQTAVSTDCNNSKESHSGQTYHREHSSDHEISEIGSSNISSHENMVSNSQVEGIRKVVKISENKPSANVIAISGKDKDKNLEKVANKLDTPSLPKIINVPKGVTIIKKIGSQNVRKQMGKTTEMKGNSLQAQNTKIAHPLSSSKTSPLEIIDGSSKAPASISAALTGSNSRLTKTKEITVGTCAPSYENTVASMDQGLIETTLDSTVNNDSSKETVKPHVNIVYVKVKPKNINPVSETVEKLEESDITSAIANESETDNIQNVMSLTVPSGTENILSDGTVVQHDNSNEVNEDDDSGAIVMESKHLLDTNMLETNKATDASESNKDPKPNGSVCEVFRMDKPVVDSPQVAIEYVVFGDRIVPIHKPFSQSNAGIYKKVSTNAKTLKKIPVKVAQTAINSLLQGKPHNAAYSIDTGDIGEDVTASCEMVIHEQEDGVLEHNQNFVGTQNEGKMKMLPPADKPQQKHGRVLHGYLNKFEPNPGPTQIVEISQDLFTKEVYGDSPILDHVTGELVSSSGFSTDDITENNSNEDQAADEGHFVELKPDVDTVSNNVIVAGMVERNKADPTDVVDMVDITTNIEDSGQLQTDVKDVPESPTQPFCIENVIGGDSVVLQIDDNGIILNETPAYRTLTNLKINPAAPAVSSEQSISEVYEGESEENEVYEGKNEVYEGENEENEVYEGENEENGEMEDTAVPTIEIKPVTSGPSLQKETETQTEIAEEEEDIESNMDYSEETVETTDTSSTNKSVVVVKNEDDSIRRTHVRMEENGVVQEYVVVHLPEGTEIKQQEVKQSVQDPVHNEPITQTKDGMYFCVDCDHTTDRRGNWYKHRRKHLGIRPHSCPKCDYKAATSSNLKRHMQIHDDVRNFECTLCGLFFRQKIHLERHIKYKHQEKKVKCPLCDYMCSSENPDLKIHIRRRHMPQEDGSMSAFTCNECGLMTVSKKDLKQHMKFHKRGPELKLFCEFCSFVTDCESRLRRHMLIHTKEKPFQCGLCSYRATQKEHVLRHMKTQHDVEVERKTRKSLLAPEPKSKLRHSLLEESQQPLITVTEPTQANKLFEKSDYSCTDKIFACNHCSMKFSKLINLYKHLFAQHKQVMPDTSTNFQCVVCDFRTNNKKNLLVHMRKHNMQDHSPPTHVYSCVLCRYINPRRRNLFQHMKKKHNIQIVMKDDGSECFVGGDVIVEQQDGEQGIMALSEIVTTHPLVDDSQLQIITEDGTSFQAEKISLDNLISVEDISAYETISSQETIPSHMTTIPGTSFQQSNIAGHEAAEAIEGLQALAEQAAGVVETHPIDSDISTEIITSEIMTDSEIMTTEEETPKEQTINDDDGIELSTEQLNQLSAGDYVEINGEVYKVEITQENAQK